MGGGTLPRAEGILLFGSSLNFFLAKKCLAPAVPRGLHLFYVRLPGDGVNPHRIWRCFGEFRVFSREGTSARMASTLWILSLATSTIIVTEVMNVD